MWTNIQKFQDDAEHVTKFVFSREDIAIESVLYRYPTYQERTVLCISVMCGCPMGCRFCGAGDFYVRNLTSEEILAQAVYILENEIGGINPNEINKLQIMVMSMGEPALNKALAGAFRVLHREYPQAALLISTSGPKVDYSWIRDLSVEIPTVGLQFSVHESTDEARDKLVPFKNKLTLAEMAEEGQKWFQTTGRKPYFNYCAHEKNTSDRDGLRISKLFKSDIWEATVSVICEREAGFSKANEKQRNLAVNFGNELVDFGFNVRVFDPAGQDTIGGGCGMLPAFQKWVAQNPSLAKPSCGNGLPLVHSPQ